MVIHIIESTSQSIPLQIYNLFSVLPNYSPQKQWANLLLRQIICYFAAIMKCPFSISFLLCCTIWLAACTGPVLIEEPEKEPTNTEQSDSIPNDSTSHNEPHENDSVPIIHEGTYTSPYSIAEAQTLGRGKSVWVEGYIVGCVSGSMKSGCNYTEEATTQSNILLADTFPTGSEEDYLQCFPVELPSNSAERDDLNLYDNPDLYHRKLRIQGDITLYYKVVGMKEVADHFFFDEDEDENEGENEGGNEGGNEPDRPNDPDATREDTLSIAKAITLQNKGEQPYIKGYIVGYYNGSSICFNPTEEQISTRARNNVVLADNAQETSNVIIVELPTETTLRQRVNLTDNPQNLHRALTVKGMLMDYKDTSYAGCMGTLSGLGDDDDYYFLLE